MKIVIGRAERAREMFNNDSWPNVYLKMERAKDTHDLGGPSRIDSPHHSDERSAVNIYVHAQRRERERERETESDIHRVISFKMIPLQQRIEVSKR